MSLFLASMTLRSKESKSIIWGRRQRRGDRDDQRARRAKAGAAQPVSSASPRSRRHDGQSQDRALYACSCGVAFDALVSTSVDCPACGDTQAW
jgi:hypothetical protein